MKPGYKTTEFYLVMGADIALIVLAFFPQGALWVRVAGIVASAVITGAYTWARMLVKAAGNV